MKTGVPCMDGTLSNGGSSGGESQGCGRLARQSRSEWQRWQHGRRWIWSSVRLVGRGRGGGGEEEKGLKELRLVSLSVRVSS